VSGFAERCGLPAVTAFRRQDCIDNDHPAYAGHLGVGADLPLERFIADSDLILAIGPRLGEATTGGYARIRAPVPSQKLVHVHPCAEELGSVYRPTLPILASLPAFCARLGGLKIAVRPEWGPRARQMRESYLETSRPVASPGNVNLAEIYASLRGLIGPDAIVTNGAGNYAAWMHRFLRNNRFGTHLGPTSGAMGYGVPAAIAAKIVHPERTVVSVNGDGCFMMCAQELATAMRYRLDPIILVVNNAMYGTIRAHQERAYPGRVSGTDLTNPDFVAFARSFGLAAERVERTEDFAGAFARARGAGTAALIELVVDPEALTPSASLTEIRERARAAAEAAD
jgi:acetolactate synthase-1/2/3 large subunit